MSSVLYRVPLGSGGFFPWVKMEIKNKHMMSAVAIAKFEEKDHQAVCTDAALFVLQKTLTDFCGHRV